MTSPLGNILPSYYITSDFHEMMEATEQGSTGLGAKHLYREKALAKSLQSMISKCSL